MLKVAQGPLSFVSHFVPQQRELMTVWNGGAGRLQSYLMAVPSPQNTQDHETSELGLQAQVQI